jgi:hypothetical protein
MKENREVYSESKRKHCDGIVPLKDNLAFQDDRTMYLGGKCSYLGSGTGGFSTPMAMAGGGNKPSKNELTAEDDRTIYAQCKCSYDGSGSFFEPSALDINVYKVA